MNILLAIIALAYVPKSLADAGPVWPKALSCTVYDSNTGERLGRVEAPVDPSKDEDEGFTVYKNDALEYGAALTRQPYPDGTVKYMITLTIVKNGKVVAHSMGRYHPAERNVAILNASSDLPAMSCVI